MLGVLALTQGVFVIHPPRHPEFRMNKHFFILREDISLLSPDSGQSEGAQVFLLGHSYLNHHIKKKNKTLNIFK